MDLSNNNKNIGNTNIFTFIKEIYNSLKYIKINLDSFEKNVNFRFIEMDKRISIVSKSISEINDKINNVQHTLDNNFNINESIDNDIQNKLSSIMINETKHSEKLELKGDELTIANLQDNNYNFDDIQKSLNLDIEFNPEEFNSSLFIDENENENENENERNINTHEETILDLVFDK